MVRNGEQVAFFRGVGTEPVIGDLTDSGSLRTACTGVDTLIATANAAVPSRAADTFRAVERDGYRNLIQAAKAAGVRRFVYTSVPLSPAGERLSEFFRYKRETEALLIASGLQHVIFRAGVFMDVAFAMMGSTLPLRGSEGTTILRPFRFANRHFERIKDSIEQKHVAFIPGDGTTRHSFICIEDVADFLVAAVSSGSGIHTIGGPEALTFLDVVRIYERLLGTQLRVRRTPAAVFRVAASLARPFSSAAANIFCLNYVAATENSLINPDAAAMFGIELTPAEQFLVRKHSLAAAA
jgi:NADH dehydrogenase